MDTTIIKFSEVPVDTKFTLNRMEGGRLHTYYKVSETDSKIFHNGDTHHEVTRQFEADEPVIRVS